MHTITIQVNNREALQKLQALENNQEISILDNADFDFPSLPGTPLSLSEFKDWINKAEHEKTVSLTEAKEKWAYKRTLLQQPGK